MRTILVSILISILASSATAEGLRDYMRQRDKLASSQQLQSIESYLQQNPKIVNLELRRLYGSGKNSPLNEALSLGDVDLVSLLLKYGANPNKASGRIQARPLQWALNDTVAPDKIAKSISLLLEAGANPNLTDKRSSTALDTWAARRSWSKEKVYTTIGDTLLKAGATVEGDGEATGTPLMVAIINNNPVATSLLLKQGADPDRRALMGTARQLAIREASRKPSRLEAQSVLALIQNH